MVEKRIPEDIKKYRPGPSTEIKMINGHYYVYMYEAIKLSSGNWGKKTGKCIGSIVPDKGFVANKNYNFYSKTEPQDEITILEYGQYALVYELAKDIHKSLEKFFNIDTAAQIFSYATLLFVNGFIHVDQVNRYYEQCWLSKENKNFTFTMGKTALSTLLDNLGRRTNRVVNYELDAISNSSSAIAIDGHAIRSCSEENDLAESGYKFKKLGEDQINLLVGYDINTHTPLFTRIYRGSCNDKSTIVDLHELFNFSGILFVVDRGFYSKTNIEIFSRNENTYVISVPSNTDVFKNAMKCIKYEHSFYYRSGNKHSRIEYMSNRISNMDFVYVFRDIDENEKCRYNYTCNIDKGKDGYSFENLEKNKEFFGVYVLQSNSEMKPEDIFSTYKKRWSIETYYQYIKNNNNFNDLMAQDYYKEQGLSFIMLIVGQIYQKVLSATKLLKDNTTSVEDVLQMARFLKIEKKGNSWNIKNVRKHDLEMFKKLGFIPQMIISD